MTQAYSFVHPVDSGQSNQYLIHQIDIAKQIPAKSHSGTSRGDQHEVSRGMPFLE